jgi:hypothetical protein
LGRPHRSSPPPETSLLLPAALLLVAVLPPSPRFARISATGGLPDRERSSGRRGAAGTPGRIGAPGPRRRSSLSVPRQRAAHASTASICRPSQWRAWLVALSLFLSGLVFAALSSVGRPPGASARARRGAAAVVAFLVHGSWVEPGDPRSRSRPPASSASRPERDRAATIPRAARPGSP